MLGTLPLVGTHFALSRHEVSMKKITVMLIMIITEMGFQRLGGSVWGNR
jgi:hypothetical protein